MKTFVRPSVELSAFEIPRILKLLPISSNRYVRVFLACVMLAVVAMLDEVTGPEISFSIFYLIPVTFLAWHNGTGWGLSMAVLAAITWHEASIYSGVEHSSPLVPFWNSGVRLGFFSLTALLLSLLRHVYEGQEALVRERTGSLVAEIEERAATETKLRESRERFRDLAENIHDVFYICDASGTITYAAPNFYTTSGYAEPEVLGREAFSFAESWSRRKLRRHFLNCARDGTKDTVYEFPVRLKHGSEVWVEQATRIIRDTAGVVVEYRNVLRDITARRKTEENIRMLADALESTSEMVSITDLSNRFVYLNRAFFEKYGYTAEEMIGRTPSLLLAAQAEPTTSDAILASTLTGGWRGELLNRKKDGTTFPIYLSTSLITKSDGSKLGYIGVAEDISEKKQAEEAVQRAESRLRSLSDLETGIIAAAEVILASPEKNAPTLQGTLANRISFVLDRMQEINKNMLVFASLASHELRTPLAIIRHQLENGLSENVSFQSLREINVTVYDEVLRMRHLVDDFLSLARLMAGTFTLKLERVGFHDVLQEFYQEAVLLSREKSIAVILQKMPTAYLMMDVARMRQVLLNLLSNSLRHTPEQGKIYLEIHTLGGSLVFTFSDTGKGFPEEKMGKIFEPFYQARDANEHHEGTGIGLAMVKGIIEAHHGTIKVSNRIPAGLTFEIVLPLGTGQDQ